MRGWESEAVFSDGRVFFSSLISDIEKSTSTITLETYIFSNDHLGQSVVEALNRAAGRGVKVRIMVDGIGSAFSSILFLSQILVRQIKFRVYHPLPWFLFLIPFQKSPALTQITKFFFGINHRNHRKTCIIDNRIAWVSGMNICESHLNWRDTGLRVMGSEVAVLACGFKRTWLRSGFNRSGFKKRAPRVLPSLLVRLNDTWSLRKWMHRDLLGRIRKAKKKIWITNAYFVPHFSLVQALCKAARRGVDIRIVVPKVCDIFFIPWVRAAYYSDLLKAGARIFEYIPSMLHSKTIIIDQWAMLGSSNLNHRSLHLDLEADIVMTHKDCKDKLSRQFKVDTCRSDEITFDDLRKRSWFQVRSGEILLLLKNWM